MKVLVACEYSGTVRDAFIRAGHDATSCDLLPTDAPGPHYQGDVRDILDKGWDLMVAHPTCTYLTNAGARWLWQYDRAVKRTVTDASGQKVPDWRRWRDMEEGADFFRLLWQADIPRIAVENPVMVGYAKALIGGGQPLEPTQSVQPYEYGHMETKRTCLWLKNLPPLIPTDDVKAATMALPYADRAKVHHAAPGPDRWKLRSTFFRGIADAMADQWGRLPVEEPPARAQ